ncbi:MAG: hypothetical protein RR202_10635 [Bacteroidales bacterium]
MKKHIKSYTSKKKYCRYDANHFLLYLNETETQVSDDEKEGTHTEFMYEGDHEDGGTMIEATGATYEAFVSGLIRKKYSADQVEAITLNRLSNDTERAEEFLIEFEALNTYRAECKSLVSELLA